MTEQPRKSIFDRSFDEESPRSPPGSPRCVYTAYLKSGVIIEYVRRSEIWKDKTNSLFVTLHDASWRAPQVSEWLFVKELDIRFNDISLMC